MSVPCIAGGTIPVSVFVKLKAGADNQVVVCGAGDPIFGISQKLNRPMMSGVALDGNAALVGEDLLVYQLGDAPGEQDETRLSSPVTESGGPVITVGAAVKSGDRLKADSLGRGVPAVLDGDQFGAIAWQKATLVGQTVSCTVAIGMRGA